MATKKTSNLISGLASALAPARAPLPPEVPAPPPTVADEPQHEPVPGAIPGICPCGKPVDTHRCRFCGAVKTVNAVSGNEIWMRNGQLVAAFRDSKSAYVEMAQKYGIPKDRWPVEFRD